MDTVMNKDELSRLSVYAKEVQTSSNEMAAQRMLIAALDFCSDLGFEVWANHSLTEGNPLEPTFNDWEGNEPDSGKNHLTLIPKDAT